ncbi:MAG: hypothetical protein NTX65_04950 [Ignavibacteriales bacterium]|nr:hypothetical protein [Ignavibacteriales bacterium]
MDEETRNTKELHPEELELLNFEYEKPEVENLLDGSCKCTSSCGAHYNES